MRAVCRWILQAGRRAEFCVPVCLACHAQTDVLVPIHPSWPWLLTAVQNFIKLGYSVFLSGEATCYCACCSCCACCTLSNGRGDMATGR